MIPYSRQVIDDEDIREVLETLRSPYITQGPRITEFEARLCEYVGVRHAIVVNSGTSALYLACRALGVGEGDLGVTSPISFVASANCVVLNGARPGFVDINPLDTNISTELLSEGLKSGRIRPKVVIPVDFAGMPADLPGIFELSKEYGFYVLEDAAHAIGSRYFHEGRWFNCGSCSHSHVAIFSFHPVKNITTGEGGAVLTNDDGIACRVRLLLNHGIERDSGRFNRSGFKGWYYELQDVSFNFRITDIQCALGLSQLKKLENFKRIRKTLYLRYVEAFRELKSEGLIDFYEFDELLVDPCPHLFVIRIGDRARMCRDELYEYLISEGIRVQVHYFPIHLQPFYMERYGFREGDYPFAEDYARRALSLPLYPTLGDDEFNRVVSLVKKCLC